MFGCYQHTGNSSYNMAFDSSFKAGFYESELDKEIRNSSDNFKKRFPVLSTAGLVGYTAIKSKEIKLTTSKLIPNTSTTYKINQNNTSVSITWGF